jgi:hypothetical protein
MPGVLSGLGGGLGGLPGIGGSGTFGRASPARPAMGQSGTPQGMFGGSGVMAGDTSRIAQRPPGMPGRFGHGVGGWGQNPGFGWGGGVGNGAMQSAGLPPPWGGMPQMAQGQPQMPSQFPGPQGWTGGGMQQAPWGFAGIRG